MLGATISTTQFNIQISQGYRKIFKRPFECMTVLQLTRCTAYLQTNTEKNRFAENMLMAESTIRRLREFVRCTDVIYKSL